MLGVDDIIHDPVKAKCSRYTYNINQTAKIEWHLWLLDSDLI